ncbi:hypothetical protein [Micromonospora sp. CB01531]|uniref:hypothetical protein n=1 Tax=Micromonospora sp. CB01531 TaxID=1718947 RepID=UPI00116154B4|nr:hypothetical protein [Micromonospora sp. CB01531]
MRMKIAPDPERMDSLRHMTTVRDGLARSRRAVGGALALVTAAMVVLAAPAPAMAAADWYSECARADVSCQTGVEVKFVPSDKCGKASADRHHTEVCILYYGDKVYVRDGQADTHSAVGIVTSSTGDIRHRYCRNPHGYDTWAECNFDWTEDSTKTVYGGYRVSDSVIYKDYLFPFSGN